jgi:hypothetical protein
MNAAHSAITALTLEAAWAQIQAKLPQAEGRSFLQKALTVGPLTLSAVIRVADGMPGLLLQIPEASYAAKWPVRHYAGVRFDPMVKFDDGYGLPLMLGDLKARDIFAQLAADIAAAAVGEETAAAKLAAILNRLALWRRFLQDRMGKMSDEEVRGLIGELSVLGSLLVARGVDSCLDAWKGPLGELHDFRLPNLRIEVKTWCNDSLPHIFISDPSQIVADESYPVWVAAIQISKDAMTGRTLSDWAGALAKSMDASQRELYYSLLADYGFLAAQSELYTDRYVVIGTIFYAVTASFPRIDPGAIPPAICSVKYAIELNAIASHAKPSPVTGEPFTI